MNAIGREESILDSLAQAVGIDRIAEIEISIAIIFTQRGSGHSQLKSRLEIGENLAPVAQIARAAPVAFVHDNQIKEVWPEFFIKAGTAFILGQGLIGGKVHFPAF